MGVTLSQKVLARASGRKHMDVGEVAIAEPDVLVLSDLDLARYLDTLRAHGITKIRNPERCVVFSPSQAARHGAVVDKGHVLPGMLVLGADNHVTTLGCVGALAAPIDCEAMQALAMGEIWLKVPETIRVILKGHPQAGVMGRDIAQQVIHSLGSELCDYRVVEFSGPALGGLDMDARMTLCSVAVDIGAKCGIVEPDEVTRAYLAPRTPQPFELVRSDPDASFCHTCELDLGRSYA